MAVCQAGACLHTMAILQAYQADLLRDLDKGERVEPDDIKELRWAADLSLRVTRSSTLRDTSVSSERTLQCQ